MRMRKSIDVMYVPPTGPRPEGSSSKDTSRMEQHAKDPFKESDIDMRDPFVERCQSKKRHSRDSFLEDEPTKRYAIDPFSEFERMQESSMNRAFRDPFEDYVHQTDSYNQADAPVVNLPEVNIPDISIILKCKEKESDAMSESSDAASYLSDADPSESNLEVPTLDIDDLEIPDLDLQSSPNLKVDDGPKLYAGAQVTSEQAIYTLVSWFSSYPGISKSAFSRLLYILHAFILPADNSLPPSYEDLLKMMKPFLSPIIDYHCCVNDCVIFRDSEAGDYARLLKCPKCDEDRYKQGTKIPRKRFKYFPLEERVRRLFSDPKTSQLLQNHTLPNSSTLDSNVITDIHQSEVWKSWYSL